MARPEPAWQPPLRDGVSASRVAVGAGHPATVGEFLNQRFPAVAHWTQRLACGDVLDAQGRAVTALTPCQQGMLLWYWRQPPPEPRVPFEIEVLHHDELLVVVDKPHFLAVTPGGRHLHETVLVRLKRMLGIATLAPLHRLDRDTAGVLVFTVQPGTRAAYHGLLRQRQVHKVYEAIAPWHAGLALPLTCRSRLAKPTDRSFMQVQVRDGEPNTETRVELIRVLGPAQPEAGEPPRHALAHYRLTPLTGYTHQLRVHMSAAGMPIVDDRIYPELLPDLAADAAPDYAQPLQLLARRIGFADPVTGQQREFTSRRHLAGAAD